MVGVDFNVGIEVTIIEVGEDCFRYNSGDGNIRFS